MSFERDSIVLGDKKGENCVGLESHPVPTASQAGKANNSSNVAMTLEKGAR